ncbi:hypothetical protein [Thiohalocapsa marina]|uniref:hypothetical protein n=1 Tax=Thiohalocapsa marina TaxID=424902 RepID=UPI001231E505|nr:hypothetical protein [Thiohalocapsa marina]
MSEQARTTAVVRLLRQGLDLKLQFGGTAEAERHLRKAYATARDPHPLCCPWPQITAYRLAHLLMRGGAETSWCEVDALLAAASSDDVLGPAPLVYRLISLTKTPPAQEEIGTARADLYQRVQRLVRQRAAGGLRAVSYFGDERPLQPDWFNLLELAVYATGLDYAPLEGWCDPARDPFAGLGFDIAAWSVVEDAESATLRYPEPIARQRFEERRKQLSPCLAVAFISARQVVTHKPDGAEARDVLKARQAQDLLSLLTAQRSHLGGHSAVRAQDLTGERRQRKHRLLQALSTAGMVLDEAAFDRWWEDPRPVNRPCSALPILMLVGPNALPHR